MTLRRLLRVPQAFAGHHHRTVSTSLPNPPARRTVYVASKNPVKYVAIEKSLKKCFPHLDIFVQAHPAASGVPDQPLSDEQTLEG
jgi:hypothetical protein